jgi:exonuclease III
MLIDQADKYKADITALQEVRWKGSGALEKRECTVFYSCSNNKHHFGTNIIINKSVQHLMIDFTALDERISCLHIKGKFFNCSLINIYATTEEKCEDEKETFYTVTEKMYVSCP